MTFIRNIVLSSLVLFSSQIMADDYVIDTKGSHAFIQFKIKHLGFSWLWGRFNRFEGTFSYDEKNPAASKVQVEIDTASVDSNHALRDKHLRDKDLLEVDKYPKAKFVSSKFTPGEKGKGVMEGTLSLHGVDKTIKIEIEEVGAGKDPWGNFRRGFTGSTTLTLSDFGIKKDLGSASKEVIMVLAIEGIKK